MSTVFEEVGKFVAGQASGATTQNGVGLLQYDKWAAADASAPLFPQALRSQGVNRIDDLSLIMHCEFTSKLRQQWYPRAHPYAGLLEALEQ